MNNVFRVFVEKKSGFDVEALGLLSDCRGFLGINAEGLRLFNLYDIQGITSEGLSQALHTVLSEPMCDNIWLEELPSLDEGSEIFAYEALSGQFDQRADSCAQCLQMLLGGERPLVRSVRVIALKGVTSEELAKLKKYLINPVESCEASIQHVSSLEKTFAKPKDTPVVEDFITLNRDELSELLAALSLAMDIDDIQHLQDYFRNTELRDPTLAELKVIDTYWSDHCRHTTFFTEIDNVTIDDPRVQRAYDSYKSFRGDAPVTLMSIATAAMKQLKAEGLLARLDESDEINACTVRVKASIGNQQENWLLLFKNETHNHPTEIEPFGGAATCIGGAIRDPLSGRAYVYQAMRVTGAADPRAAFEDTVKGKLPQRKITTSAAAGYSSYGNQIGLATGLVSELYHPGYAAKRMELGAVIAAAPEENVVRETPEAGDIVILLGGRTGRDGIGGATGSSKTHNTASVEACAAEVQKGNAPEERKLQRLFRNSEVTKKIKKCNDFGAGGVAVAIGELADGLKIDLSRVPKKYEGLGGLELAISESQERMAIVVERKNVSFILDAAAQENLEATPVALVTDEPRLVMEYNGKTIVNLSREFLNTNGAKKHTDAVVRKTQNAKAQKPWKNEELTLAERFLLLTSDLNFCSQRGLGERFDGSIGAGSVLMPFGGTLQHSPTQVIAATLPVTDATTASVMSFGFDPYVSETDCFGGAVYSVVTSVAKLVAAGAPLSEAYLSLQEYFPRTQGEPERWGLPMSALLGAYEAQMGLGIAAIGGKDSMSGTYVTDNDQLDVPPTLVSFAVAVSDAERIISPELKQSGTTVCLWKAPVQPDGLPDYKALKAMWESISALTAQGKLHSAWACDVGGVAGGIIKSCFGNSVGFEFDESFKDYFDVPCGSIIAETDEFIEGTILVGRTNDGRNLVAGDSIIPISTLLTVWEKPLENVFPTLPKIVDTAIVEKITCPKHVLLGTINRIIRPKVVIPTFPGTNCELDTARAVEAAGGEANIVLIRNLTGNMIEQSALDIEKALSEAQMMIIPGGFSGGDEPDGSGKYIVSFFRHARVKEAVSTLLSKQDGLILGICNGFQALIKLGLVPFGSICDLDENCPTLTFNRIGRHQSRYVSTRVSSSLSPWLSCCELGAVYTVPISHGEGRFVAPENVLKQLSGSGQIAQQYCDANGTPSMSIDINPNGSMWAIEGLTSPDGRVFGKMAHSERCGEHVAKNIYGAKYQPLFEGGVNYFK